MPSKRKARKKTKTKKMPVVEGYMIWTDPQTGRKRKATFEVEKTKSKRKAYKEMKDENPDAYIYITGIYYK